MERELSRRDLLRDLGLGALALSASGCVARREVARGGTARDARAADAPESLPHRGGGAAGRKPNIVYIMSDELGYYELSCMGHPRIRTPVVDRMAAEGIRFTQALAGSSLCAPTRCCLMTGKHSGHTSVRANDGGTPLREGEETVASVLKRAGYATGGFGKWGCGGRGSTGVPERHGFDVFVGYYDQVHAHSYYPPYIVRNSEEVPLAGNEGGRSGGTYSHYVIMDEAKKFIRANAERPFFCYLPVTPPHGMFDIPEDDPAWALYRDDPPPPPLRAAGDKSAGAEPRRGGEPWPGEARRYAAMVTMLDRHVGEVLALLEELGAERDTVVFFCGDNGGQDYFRGAEHPRGFHGPNVNPRTGAAFRGHKGNLYEGGLRIPMIARWPGRIVPGRTSDHLWYFPDVLPTVADLAGAPCPDDTDGISIVPELLGEEAAGRRQERHEYLYWELGRQTAVRVDHWKAVRPRADADWELYDLRSDIEEKNDVAAAHADVLAGMIAHAAEAHEDARPGVFHGRAIHERDRRAKWGGKERPGGRENSLPREGLIPQKEITVRRASSESRFNGKLAGNAVDGDPSTLWHSKFRDGALGHPHELVLDLGGERTVRGFRYLCRQDGGWNGALKDCEFYVSRDPERFAAPAARAVFRKTRKAQEVKCAPVRGRYVLLRSLSEVNGGPWASVAELGVVGE